MATYQTIHDLTALGAAPAGDDELEVWDASASASKRATVAELATAVTSAGGIATDAEVASAVSTHSAATDPHGDRAFASAAVAALSTVYQPLDSDLTAIAALTTAWGRALLALADAPAARTALGLGTISTQAAGAVAITGGTVTGITDLAVADGGTGASTARLARSNLRLIDTSLAAEILRTAAGDWSAADLAERIIANRGVMGSSWDANLGTSAVTPGSADPTVPVFGGSRAVRLPGTVGNYASCPDSAALDITGDLEIVCRVALDDWSPAGSICLAGKWSVATQKSYALHILASGALALYLSSDGSTSSFAISSSVELASLAAGAGQWIRATWRQADGRVQFFRAPDQTNEPTSWTQVGPDATVAISSIYVGTGYVEIGSGYGGASFLGPCQHHRAIVRNGGTVVANFDARMCGQPGYTDAYGNTWTVNRSSTGLKTMLVDEDPPLLFGTDDRLTVNGKLGLGPHTLLVVCRRWGRPASFGHMFTCGWNTAGSTAYATSAADTITASVKGTGSSPAVTIAHPPYGQWSLLGLVFDGASVWAAANAALGTPATLAGSFIPQVSAASQLVNNDDGEYYRWLHWSRALTAYELGRVAQHLGVA
jgi:hypothetical protein